MTNRVARGALHVRPWVVIAAMSGAAVWAQGPAPTPATAGPAAQGQTSSSAASTSQPAVLSYGVPGKHILLDEGTLIRVMTEQSLNSERSKAGTPVLFTVSEDVIVGNVVVIPRGATVHGEVVEGRQGGRISGIPQLTLKLDSLELGGQSYPLYAYHLRAEGTSKTKPTAAGVVGGAEVGAIAGAVIASKQSGGTTPANTAKVMGAGAAAGAGVVALAAAATPRPQVDIPAESQMEFHLAVPISVQPVSEDEAERLSKRVRPGGPVLYVHDDTP